jgi:hypothetical protein
MRRAILFAMTAATAVVLSTGMFIGLSRTAEAAKPQFVFESVSLVDEGDCVATLTWSGLKGGKPLEIMTNLRQKSGGGSVQGATQTYTVRQGDGQLVIHYGAVPNATDSSLTFEATFVMQGDDVFVSASGSCDHLT